MQARGSAGGDLPEAEDDDKWAQGQNCLLYLRSAKNDYYTRLSVLQTKSRIRDVLETKLDFYGALHTKPLFKSAAYKFPKYLMVGHSSTVGPNKPRH